MEPNQNFENTFLKETIIKISKNKGAMIGAIILLVIALMAIIGPHLTNYTYFETHLRI